MPASRRTDSDTPRRLASESGRLSPAPSSNDLAAVKRVDESIWATSLFLLTVLGLFALLTVATFSTGMHHVGALVAMAFVFAFAPLIDELWIIKKLAGEMPVGATYTGWNCLLLTWTAADHFLLGRPPVLLPCLVMNSWAIFASFNVVRLFDASLFQRAAAWTGYGLPAFHAFNQLFHTLPACLATLWFAFYRPIGTCSMGGSEVFGIIAFHLLYAMRTAQSLFLDKVYFECPRWEWGVAWITALVVHLTVGREVVWQCSIGEAW